MTLSNRIPPPVIAAACALLIYAMRNLHRVSFVLQHVVAVLILFASLATMLLAVREFHRARTTINPLKPESASVLVQRGIFARSRNPMYLGLAGVLLAWTVFLGATAGFAVIAVFVIWMNRFQIRPEENAMAALFGAEFTKYRSRVRRWL